MEVKDISAKFDGDQDKYSNAVQEKGFNYLVAQNYSIDRVMCDLNNMVTVCCDIHRGLIPASEEMKKTVQGSIIELCTVIKWALGCED